MRQFPISDDATITIDIQAATVQVTAADRDDVAISVEPSNPNRSGDRDAAERVSVSPTSGGLDIVGERRLLIGTPGSVDVQMEVPAGTHLSAVISAGSLSLRNRLGDVDVKIAAGDVRSDTTASLTAKVSHGSIIAEEVTGDVEVQQSSGEIQLGAIGGSARIKSGHGSIRVGHLRGTAHFVTATGGVHIGEVSGEMRVRTGHGAVRLGRVSGGIVHLDTGFGTIEVGVASGAPVWVDADSKNGVVRTDLESGAGPADDELPVEVHASTKFGDIIISRAG
ncbi:putative adhesin [Brevibacterium sanguinis]|uniref:Adhesin n=2 Tax=Brevibacterium TaxID=1696 RepID=A0ABX9GQB6_9MICO|nr:MULTISPECIES: DUF4097 family beta strand repeat-containing protein [Brevibacterium]RBP62902.1 putative adhesin [Brevibacterium sanguinis]RBP69553.1 putative adhesin [Brevibacterium celere]